jgi:hypothetical protein
MAPEEAIARQTVQSDIGWLLFSKRNLDLFAHWFQFGHQWLIFLNVYTSLSPQSLKKEIDKDASDLQSSKQKAFPKNNLYNWLSNWIQFEDGESESPISEISHCYILFLLVFFKIKVIERGDRVDGTHK